MPICEDCNCIFDRLKPQGCIPRFCGVCKQRRGKEIRQRYWASPKGRSIRHKHQNTEEFKGYMRGYMKIWGQPWRQTAAFKAYRKKYYATPIAKQQAQQYRDKNRERIRKYARAYCNTPQYYQYLENYFAQHPDKIRNRCNSPMYIQWRSRVFQRDDFTCLECGKRGGGLNAHHIYTYIRHPEKRYDTNNGITLCMHCHNGTKGKEDLFIERFLNKVGGK